MTESSSWGLWQSFLICGLRIFLGFDFTSEHTSLGTSEHSSTGSRLGTISVSFQHLEFHSIKYFYKVSKKNVPLVIGVLLGHMVNKINLGIDLTLHFSVGFSETICTIFSWQCFFPRLIMQFEVRGKQSFCATRLHFSLGNLLRLVRFLISQIRFGTIVQSSKTEYPLDFCWHTFSSRSWQLATLSTTLLSAIIETRWYIIIELNVQRQEDKRYT